jgi:hypothetical protein
VWRLDIEGAYGDQEVAPDSVVFFLGIAVSGGVYMVPAGAYCRPQEGDEFACPDFARVEFAVEFETVVVLVEVIVLESTPLLAESSLDYYTLCRHIDQLESLGSEYNSSSSNKQGTQRYDLKP